MKLISYVWDNRVRLWLGLVLTLPCVALGLSHRYDAVGRLTWSVQPGGQATHFTYDAAGNIGTITTILPAQDTDADGLPDTWEIRYSGTVTGRNAASDSDGDGLIDLQEFAFTRLPDLADGANLTPVSLETTAGGTRLTLRYLRPTQGTATLNYITEVSTNLQAWSSEAADVEQLTPVAQGNGLELVTVQAQTAVGSTPRLFLRIRLVQR